MPERQPDATEPVFWEWPQHHDERGWFSVLWNDDIAREHLGYVPTFVQSNASQSQKNSLRGMHYQIGENAQDKLVSVMRGRALDVVVDIRRSSPGFGSWQSFDLDAASPHFLWVPAGFAHGFLALESPTLLHYQVTARYDPEAERAVHWADATVAIDWPVRGAELIVSSKDAAAPRLVDADLPD